MFIVTLQWSQAAITVQRSNGTQTNASMNGALCNNHMRPVPTKWETSRKISFPSYNQIHVVQTLSFKMIYYM